MLNFLSCTIHLHVFFVSSLRKLISDLSEHFDQIVKEEREALEENIGEEESFSWKRVVFGVREMCDVCDATLFNSQWACTRCGFVVCVGCYRIRKSEDHSHGGGGGVFEGEKDKDEYGWLMCNNKQTHDLEKLVFAQMVPGDILEETAEKLRQYAENTTTKEEADEEEEEAEKVANGVKKEVKPPVVITNGKDGQTTEVLKMGDLIDRTIENSMEEVKKENKEEMPLDHFVRQGTQFDFGSFLGGARPVSGVAHRWLDGGRVLRLEDGGRGDGATNLFAEVWKRREPVVVAKASEGLNKSLWELKALDPNGNSYDAFNVREGKTIFSMSLGDFMDGFDDVTKRSGGEKSVVAVRNWPPTGEEFAEILQPQLQDLVKDVRFVFPVHFCNARFSFPVGPPSHPCLHVQALPV